MSQQMTPKEKRAWDEWLEACRRIREGKQPIKDENETARKKRIASLLDPKNFEAFAKYYFEDYCSAPFAWFHKEAVKDVLVKRERNNIWEWPRESAKSVFADVFIVCNLLFTGWLDGLILASENEDKAKNLIKDVQAELMNNPRIIADFGDFNISGSWLSGYFQTKGGIGFWAFGLGQNPAGVRNGHRRPNLGIIDDADNKDKARNQKLTRERVDWIKGEFMGCLQTKGHIFIFANNRLHKHGLTAHIVGDLEEGDPKHAGYKHIKVFFTEDPKTKAMLELDAGGVPAWKERFTKEDCRLKLEDMGYRNAMRQLYHQHIEEGHVFKEEDLPWGAMLPLPAYDALVTYCDPAFGESGKGCFRAIVLVGRKGLDYHVLWAWLSQTGNFAKAHRELAEKIEGQRFAVTSSVHAKVSVTHWVESNELQKLLLKKIYQEINAEMGDAWYPKFDMDKKADKIGRIESMETIAQNRHIVFNASLRDDKHLRTLREQFIGFPDGYVDGPDAVEGAIAKIRKMKPASKTGIKGGKYNRNTKRR